METPRTREVPDPFTVGLAMAVIIAAMVGLCLWLVLHGAGGAG